MPQELAYLWGWFLELHSGRTQTAMGPAPASHLDLMAWQSNNRIALEPWEARALMYLGQTWARAMSEKREH